MTTEMSMSALKPASGQGDLQSLAETLSSLIVLIQDGKVVYVNPAGCRLLGRERQSLNGCHLCEVFHLEGHDAGMARAAALTCGAAEERPPARRLTDRLVHADGRTVWLEYSLDAVWFEGRPTTLLTGNDVTDRVVAEENLRKSRQSLAEAQRIARVGSWEQDLATGRETWSDELFRILGLDPTRVEPSYELFLSRLHPEDRQTMCTEGEGSCQDGQPFECVQRAVLDDGSVRTLKVNGQVDRDAKGRAVRMYGVVQDITEGRRAEQALLQSEERFRLAFTHAAIGKAIVAPDRRLVQVNPAACRMLGYSEEELLGLSTVDVTLPEDVAKTDDLFRRLLDAGEVSAAIEKRFRHRDGHIVWAQLTATLVRDAAGAPHYVIAEIEDITERKKAEEALRASEERFRNLVTQAPVMMMAFDPSGCVRDVSNYWLQTTGYAREEIIGREAWHLLTPESQDRLQKAIDENERSRRTVIKNLPLRGLRKDGSPIDMMCTSVAEIGDDGESKGAICVEIDLTDLQRAEAALLESEERYRALVEHAPEAIMVLDVEQDRFVDANAHAEKLFGFSRAKLLTMGPLDFCTEHQADGRRSCEVVEDEYRKVLEGETTVFEFNHVDASGREIACQMRMARLPAAGRKLIRLSVTDVSELKHLQEKVRHADKLAAAGVLAAGVAHEIGNPLTALSMAAQSLERRGADEYTQTKLTLIREHIDRISRIVRQMSDIARPHNGKRGACDVNQVVKRAVEIVKYDKRSKGSEVRYELAEHLPDVAAIEDELMQVCINLALNAFDAMAENPPDRARRLTVASAVSESGVSVLFRDTGTGVSEQVRSKLFQPFFTTKEVGRGSGLGLSVSYRILQEHGGTLRLAEDDGPGACFVFELPRERPTCSGS